MNELRREIYMGKCFRLITEKHTDCVYKINYMDDSFVHYVKIFIIKNDENKICYTDRKRTFLLIEDFFDKNIKLITEDEYYEVFRIYYNELERKLKIACSAV